MPDTGKAISHAVMDLADDHEAISSRTVDDPQLPEGPIPIERPRQDLADGLLEATLAEAGIDAEMPNVRIDVEVRIVDPEYPAREGCLCELLAEPWHPVQPRRDVITKPVDVDTAARVRERCGLERERRSDVHR